MWLSQAELETLLAQQAADDAKLRDLLVLQVEALKIQLDEAIRRYSQLVDSVMESRGVPPPHAARETTREPRPHISRPLTWSESRRQLERLEREPPKPKERLNPVAEALEQEGQS